MKIRLYSAQFANARELVDLIVRSPSVMRMPDMTLGLVAPQPNLKTTEVLDRDGVMCATQFQVFREVVNGKVKFSIMIS